MIDRPIILGIVGDSAAGKTTLTRGIAQILGEDDVTVICTDDYHRYDRKQRAEMGISALHPDCNYLDIIQQHLSLLRTGHGDRYVDTAIDQIVAPGWNAWVRRNRSGKIPV